MKQIITQFIEAEHLQDCHLFGNGHIHDTYKIGTEKGNFILQRINTSIFRDVVGVMQNIERVANHLQQQSDYPMEVLSPSLFKQGENHYRDNEGSYWRMFPFIEQTHTYSKIEQPEEAYPIAHAFGTFIRALSDLPSEKLMLTIPNFHDGLYRFQQLKTALIHANPSRLKAAKESLDLIFKEQAVFKEIAALQLPTRIVHNDTKADNILLDKNNLQAKCVIDLDTVMPGTLLSDFGDMVRTCTNSETEDSDNFDAIEMQLPIYNALEAGFLDALQDSINEVERNALYVGAKWIILEQATRFLSDFLNNDRYYKTQYPMHNLVRAKNQIMLYCSLVKKL